MRRSMDGLRGGCVHETECHKLRRCAPQIVLARMAAWLLCIKIECYTSRAVCVAGCVGRHGLRGEVVREEVAERSDGDRSIHKIDLQIILFF